jgi:hypothetical protein
LQGEQGALLEQRLHLATVADVLAQVGQVLVLAGGVDHQEQGVVTQVGDHQVVEDAALFVGEHGIALHAHRQVDDVHRHQAFQRLGGISAAQAIWPMCETSNRPACSRVCRCSLSTPSGYCTGMS